MANFEDDTYNESLQQQNNVEDSNIEDELDKDKPMTDTSALEARNGKDIQGIPWERMNFTREKYRDIRLKEYKNYVNLPGSCQNIQKEYKQVEMRSTFYDFQFNTRIVKSTIVHFQRGKEVLNVTGPTVPTLKHPGSLAQPLGRVQIRTMAVKDNLLVAGGCQGELICKNLEHPGVAFCTKFTNQENNITNALDIYQSSNGLTRLMTANNDAIVRVFDTEYFACLNHFPFSWPVNNISVSPDGKLIAVLGDSMDCLVADAQSGKVVKSLKGHLDYSFASAWHPDGKILATGNQDTTCRLWDERDLSQSLNVHKGRMGAIRAVKFTSDGRFMAMAEPADFVHIYDIKSGYSNMQEIDLFGEIAGISFSPDTQFLFVGVADRTYGSVLEFNRRHYSRYLDTFI